MGGDTCDVKDIHSATAGKIRSQRGVARTSVRGPRRNFDKRVTGYLEWVFRHCRYPSHDDRLLFARQTGLSTEQVKTWFQNRRLKEKTRADKMAVTPLPPSSTHPHTAGTSTVSWPCAMPTGGVSVEALTRLGVVLPSDLATSNGAMALARPKATSGQNMEVPPAPSHPLHHACCGPMPAATNPAFSIARSPAIACPQHHGRDGTTGVWHTAAKPDITQLLPGNEVLYGSCDKRFVDTVASRTHGFNALQGVVHSAAGCSLRITTAFGEESPSPGSTSPVSLDSTHPLGCGQGLSVCGQGSSLHFSPGNSRMCVGPEDGVRCGMPGDLGLSLARLVQSWSVVSQ